MELKTVPLEIPEGVNLILGQTHFIKTVEDVGRPSSIPCHK